MCQNPKFTLEICSIHKVFINCRAFAVDATLVQGLEPRNLKASTQHQPAGIDSAFAKFINSPKSFVSFNACCTFLSKRFPCKSSKPCPFCLLVRPTSNNGFTSLQWKYLATKFCLRTGAHLDS